ncbi:MULTISPECIES: nuclear transport factor 2 family protein [unclassified Micromonospora]|uniref:nuclear transport factor 2 family protein n=1 Tax=unclassified Micromonospora TaxID=2617518 RepID=UPI003320475E
MAEDILRLSREFDEAELHADTDRLERLLADDFVSIGERGFVLTKAQWIARHGDFRLISSQTTDANVRHYDRTSILHGVQRVEATWLGEPMTLSVRFSQVWVQQTDGWRLASVQFSTLAPM